MDSFLDGFSFLLDITEVTGVGNFQCWNFEIRRVSGGLRGIENFAKHIARTVVQIVKY